MNKILLPVWMNVFDFSQVLNVQLLYFADLNVVVELWVGDFNHWSWMEWRGDICRSRSLRRFKSGLLSPGLLARQRWSLSSGNWSKSCFYLWQESNLGLHFFWRGCAVINRIDSVVNWNRYYIANLVHFGCYSSLIWCVVLSIRMIIRQNIFNAFLETMLLGTILFTFFLKILTLRKV